MRAKAPTRLVLSGDKLLLFCSFADREAAKEIDGYTWNARLKCWSYPLGHFEQVRQAFPFAIVDPDLQAKIDLLREMDAAIEAAKQEGWEHVEPAEPMPIKTKPFQHQVLGYNIAGQLLGIFNDSEPGGGAALLMEQGCGKTLAAIAVAGRAFLNGNIDRVMVFAPASVVPVWPNEFRMHADFDHEVIALEGPVKRRVAVLEGWERDRGTLQVAATNYEASWRMDEAIKAWQPDLIICDESQRIKTPGAQQSKALHRLGRAARYRMILTGTPISNNPLEFFSQYKFLDPSIFGNSYYAFRNRYATMGGFEGRQVVGFRNLPELTKKAHAIAYRVTKEEALDLPPFIDQTLYCELEPKAARAYTALAKESVAELDSGEQVTAANVLARLLRLSQLTGGYVGTEEGETEQVSTAKLSLLAETLDDLLVVDGKKIVIFARFLAEIEAIKGLLADRGVDYEWITGAVPMAERGGAVERFQQQPQCRVFLAQIQTAGLGITLTAADTAIFYSLDFSFANYDQCRARIHRLGQKNACTYIHLVVKSSVDEQVLGALLEKKDMAALVVDDWRSLFK